METITIEKLKESLQNILNDTLLSHNGDRMKWTFFKENMILGILNMNIHI